MEIMNVLGMMGLEAAISRQTEGRVVQSVDTRSVFLLECQKMVNTLLALKNHVYQTNICNCIIQSELFDHH